MSAGDPQNIARLPAGTTAQFKILGTRLDSSQGVMAGLRVGWTANAELVASGELTCLPS